MNKNFKEKQRENILIKLVSKYEQKIKQEDKQINELNRKKRFSENLIYALELNIKYWSAMVGVNLLLFPVIGYFQNSIATGITMWIISTIAIGISLLFCNTLKNKANNYSNELTDEIDQKEQDKDDYQKDLDKLKKHITPTHVEYNIKHTDEKNNAPYIESFFTEETEDYKEESTIIENCELDSVCGLVAVFSNDKIEDTYSQPEGPTLVKTRKAKRR